MWYSFAYGKLWSAKILNSDDKPVGNRWPHVVATTRVIKKG